MEKTQENVNEASAPKPKKLLDRVRETMRLRHYSIRTEEAYVDWIVRFILFHNKRHPKDMGPPEIETFLTHLAAEANVAASTQNQAFHAVLFLYRQVLNISLEGESINALRARKKKNLPVVLTKEEVKRVIALIPGKYQLMAKIMYGAGRPEDQEPSQLLSTHSSNLVYRKTKTGECGLRCGLIGCSPLTTQPLTFRKLRVGSTPMIGRCQYEWTSERAERMAFVGIDRHFDKG